MPPKGAKKPSGEKGDKSKKKAAKEGEKKGEASPEEVFESPKCRKELKIPKKLENEQDTSLDVDEVVGWALHGKMDCEYPENSKIVRIFTSSTFTGKIIELRSRLIQLLMRDKKRIFQITVDWNLALSHQKFLQNRQPFSNNASFRVAIRATVLLTHWGRVTHICVKKLTIIVSDNGLSPGRRHAIIWTNAEILLIGPLGTNLSEI